MSKQTPAGVIQGDRADVLYRRQKEIKGVMERIVSQHHEGEKFDGRNVWVEGAVRELYGYIDRVIRHQTPHGGRPGNSGRGA